MRRSETAATILELHDRFLTIDLSSVLTQLRGYSDGAAVSAYSSGRIQLRHDRQGSFLACPTRAQPFRHGIKIAYHLIATLWIIDQSQNHICDNARARAVLNKLGHNFHPGQKVRHAEMRGANKEPTRDISEPCHFINK